MTIRGPGPDPRSRWQPYGVHGLSRSYDPEAFGWRTTGWTGRSLAGGVIYELHLGTVHRRGHSGRCHQQAGASG